VSGCNWSGRAGFPHNRPPGSRAPSAIPQARTGTRQRIGINEATGLLLMSGRFETIEVGSEEGRAWLWPVASAVLRS
jgi:hypothetical protein